MWGQNDIDVSSSMVVSKNEKNNSHGLYVTHIQ